jgi:PAS domain S-box-containing protein
MTADPRTPGFRSLRARTMLPALAVGILLVAATLACIQSLSVRHVASRRGVRARMLSHLVVGVAESTPSAADLQRLVHSMGSEHEIDLIVVAAGRPPRVIASTREAWIGRPVADLGEPALARQVVQTRARGAEAGVPLPDPDAISWSVPLSGGASSPVHDGVVVLHFNARAIHAQVSSWIRSVAILLVALLLASFLAAEVALRYFVLRPIGEIAAATDRRRRGDHAAQAPVLANDELGLLAAAINDANRETDEAARRLGHQMYALDQAAVVSITDAKGVIVDVNDRYCELSGYSREELVGRTHRVVSSGLHPPEFFADLWDTVNAGRVWHGEICNRAKNGSLFWASSTLIPSHDAAGHVERITAAIHDITERKRQEEASRESEARTRLVVDSALDAVITMDDGGCITGWNVQAERTFGWSAEEVLGHALTETIIPAEFRRAHERGLERFRRTQEGPVLGQRIEVSALRRNGEAFPVELAITALPSAGGHFFSAFVRDISDRKRAETELVQAKETAQAATRAKSEFLATMSHEIRTPMNGVIGFTDLLLDSPLDANQREYAETIKHSGTALLSLINDILDFSKIEAGRLDVEKLPFDARQSAAEAVELLAAKAAERKLELVFDWAPGAPRWLVGDAMRFRQVLLNLAGNAIKFTESGVVAVRVDVSAPGQLRVAVSDTGIGIAADKLASLFRKFTQADSSTTRRFGGTGLGLAISKQLVELMGGEIGAESMTGAGSTFWFTLPLPAEGTLDVPADAPPASAPASAAAAEPASTSGLVTLPMFPGTRVLIAEDQAINQKLAVRVLRRAGCTVDVANNGLEACEMAELHAYDVVFMDCHMPVRDGFEATAEIRRWEQAALASGRARRHLPIVALTASVLKADRDHCYAAGMDDFISKPFRPDQVYSALQRWTRGGGESERPLREAA